MAMCAKCGASWTSPGMILCPICGAQIKKDTAALEPSQEKLQPEVAAVGQTSASRRAPVKSNGTAVLSPPPTRILEPEPEARRPATRATTIVKKTPEPPAPVIEKVPPLQISVFPKPEPKAQAAPPPPAPAPVEPAVEIPKVEPPPARKETARVDASVVLLKAPLPDASPESLPVSSRPLNAPIILGALALVTGVTLPLTMAFESNRIMGILGFCMSGFFVPFAPIAWIAGLSAEKRRREQGLRPEKRVVLGRQLGQWGTLLLVAEVTAFLILIAGMRLAGKFPSTFWTTVNY